MRPTQRSHDLSMLCSCSSNPIISLCLSTCKAGDKNSDSARVRFMYADAEEIMRSVCVAAYRVIGDAT